MKKTAIAFGIAFITTVGVSTVAVAQQETAADSSFKSLYEQFTEVKQKTDRFNFYLNTQGSFDANFRDTFQQGAFNMRQLRIEAKGNLNSWLSYRWRQRLNRPNNSSNSIDNLPTSIDIAGIGVKLSDKASLFLGKQCAAYGGIEFDLNPIEIYEYSDMIENMSNFLTGVNFAYSVTPEHQIQLQVLNSLNNSFQETYDVSIEKSKLPLVYTLNWNGSMFNNVYQTRWSASIMSQGKDKNMYYYALGNQFNISPKFNMFFDALYSNEGIDRKGIISGIVSSVDPSTALDVTYLTFVSKMNFMVQPSWNLFIEGMYETASTSKANNNVEKGKYRTSYGYLGGLEYYPMKTNLHFFLTYIGRSFTYEDRAKNLGFENYNTSRISLGFIYQIKMF